uniref:Dilute domain-containing protein n=1 Tax=Leersia perrieri TaxID=77586 RepID=A0A0D9X9J3_9ORYZ
MGAKDNGEVRDEKGLGSDYEPARVSGVSKKLMRKDTRENSPRMAKSSGSRQVQSKLQHKASNSIQNRSPKPKKAVNAAKSVEVRRSDTVRVPSRAPSELSEETDDMVSEAGTIDDKGNEEAKEIDVLDEAPHCDQSTGTDDEIPEIEEKIVDEDKSVVYQRNEELQSKIDRLEQELREVAALEVSLYSVLPEHGSSAHKLHTPARRLSRMYIHASKFWSSDKIASVAKNTVSGLVLVAKSCSNDASRLTFWLSNTVVLREIIAQTLGVSRQLSTTITAINMNGGAKRPMLWKNGSIGKQTKFTGVQIPDDWQETSTFLAALEKIESWIFSRIVETVWWQALTPHMQTPVEGSSTPKAGRVLGPSLGDQQQGTFSVNLWKAAFHDAFNRICPLRAGGHECGCLPVLAKLVMVQCVARLDVAMFNAILRESASEIPTDPISDPIVDPKVLPIPAGDLSFGSGAQLKNSIGNWSRWLTDNLGIDADDSEEDDTGSEGSADESKSFQLLNELSDLLMLPKDMLQEKSIRKEICPSIGLPLVTRILCNFTPDEFCPDPVPSIVLEELNSESLLERCTIKDVTSAFPCVAAPVVYRPPMLLDVAEKVADTGGNAKLDRRASMVQRRGYTSDDDLDDLDSPLASLIDKSAPPSPSNGVAHFTAQRGSSMENARFTLLRELKNVMSHGK